MSEREFDEHQNSLFEDYQRRLRDDPAAAAPRDLDLGLAEVARRLEADMGGPNPDPTVSPDPAFVASLRQRIVGEAERLSQPKRPAYGPAVNGRTQDVPRKRREQRLPTGRPARGRSVYWGTLAAGLAVLLVVGGLLWTREPNEVSAHEIVQRAQERLETPTLAGIDSFKLTEVTTTNFSFDGPLRMETTHWYQAPDQWRIVVEETIGEGDESGVERYGTVSTGEEVWLWSPHSAERVEQPQGSGDIVQQMRFGGGLGNLDLALVSENDCYSPTRQGDDTVAGRAVYVIDLGVSTCPSASMPEVNGRRVIWVDKETFFILKAVQYDGQSGQEDVILSETVVTDIEYNLEIQADTFSPPVTETAESDPTTAQPTPAPTTLEDFREIADYPIFVPTYLPAGFASAELEDAGGAYGAPQVSIAYSDASGDRWLNVLNGPVGCCLSYKAGTGVALPNGIPAHFISGQPEGGIGILWWEQDGAYVSIDSTHASLSHAELMEIANSMSSSALLEPVPSAEATEPPPTATTMPPVVEVDIRYPAWLPQPSTITEEQRSDGRGGEFTMLLIDHKPNDDANDMLRLAEYPIETAPAPADNPQTTVEQIDGREVTVIHRGGACTTMSWQQDGLALTLTNAYDPPGEILYTCDEMRQIVTSIAPGASPPTN